MQIVFEGQSHQIDANTLINVLIHYQTVINEANKELGGGARSIELKVNAIEKGSFIIDVSMVESLKQIFNGEVVEYLSNLCGIVGGVFGFYQLFKGKPVKKEDEKQALVVVSGNDNVVNIYKNTIVNIYNQPVVREAISKSIETVDSDINVEGLRVDSGTNKPIVFRRADFKDYIYDDFDLEKAVPEERDEIVDAVLTIIALNFESGSRWLFLYNGFKIAITVKDDALIRRIDEGDTDAVNRFLHKYRIEEKLRFFLYFFCRAYYQYSYIFHTYYFPDGLFFYLYRINQF